MTELIEHVLRDTLRRRAEDVSSAAAARLLAVDYHPRGRRAPRLPLLGALGAAAAAAAAVVAIVLSVSAGPGAQPAFARWTPRPTKATRAQVASLLSQCTGHGRPKVVDVRGPFVAAIYASRRGNANLCLEGAGGSASGGATSESGLPKRGQIQTFNVGLGVDSAGATLLGGRVGAGVAAVRIDRRSGAPITATLEHGWYLVWWPRGVHVTTAEIITTAGTRRVQLPAGVTTGPPACGRNTSCASVGSSQSIG